MPDLKTVTFDATLLPCPFCGGIDLEIANTHTASFWVACNDCDAEVHGDYVEGPQRDDKFHYQAFPDDSRLEASYEDLYPEYQRSFRSAVLAWNTRAPTPAAQSADHFRQQANMVNHSGDATEKVPNHVADSRNMVAAQSAGQEPVGYRYRHSETESWRYGATPQNWWECRPMYDGPSVSVTKQSAGQEAVPLGAIENGRTFADRLESYPFESQGGELRMCSDWQEFRRCFEHLAQWAMHESAPVSSVEQSNAELLDALIRITHVYEVMRQTLAEKYPQDGWSKATMTLDVARDAIKRATPGNAAPVNGVERAIDLAIAFEQQRALSIVRAVRAQNFGSLNPDIPTQASAAFDLACEEIEHRLRTEQWTLGGVPAPLPDADAPQVSDEIACSSCGLTLTQSRALSSPAKASGDGLIEQHARDSAELRRLCAARDEARRTAEYWKANHLAGNAEIERLKKLLEERASEDEPLEPSERHALDSACADIAAVQLALGLPEEDAGGVDSILEAIEALQARAALSADGGEHLSENDVLTLLGHAQVADAHGEVDMPAYFHDLAERVAKTLGDKALAERCAALAASQASNKGGEA